MQREIFFPWVSLLDYVLLFVDVLVESSHACILVLLLVEIDGCFSSELRFCSFLIFHNYCMLLAQACFQFFHRLHRLFNRLLNHPNWFSDWVLMVVGAWSLWNFNFSLHIVPSNTGKSIFVIGVVFPRAFFLHPWIIFIKFLSHYFRPNTYSR